MFEKMYQKIEFVVAFDVSLESMKQRCKALKAPQFVSEEYQEKRIQVEI